MHCLYAAVNITDEHHVFGVARELWQLAICQSPPTHTIHGTQTL